MTHRVLQDASSSARIARSRAASRAISLTLRRFEFFGRPSRAPRRGSVDRSLMLTLEVLANAPTPSLRSRYEYATHDGRRPAVHQRVEQADGARARPARRA